MARFQGNTVSIMLIVAEKPPDHEAKNSVDSTCLNERDHHAKLLGQLEVHATRWREIGTYLGFRQIELDIIQGNPILFSQGPILTRCCQIGFCGP